MDTKKIASAVLGLEDVVDAARDLHAIALVHYDSFVEGRAFSGESQVYKTMTSIIEREAGQVYGQLLERFNELYALVREGEKQK